MILLYVRDFTDLILRPVYWSLRLLIVRSLDISNLSSVKVVHYF